MTMATMDDVVAGLTPPRFFWKRDTVTGATNEVRSAWAANGNPGAGSYDTTLNGVTLTGPQNGGISFADASPSTRYLAVFQATEFNRPPAWFVLDRLWHNGGYTITSTSAQNSTTPTWPARDRSGSTNGDGVHIALEVSATVGAASPNVTITYTNSDGTASRTGECGTTGGETPSGLSGATAGKTQFMLMQGTDRGVRSVQSLQLSASWVSGTINLVACRPIFSDFPGQTFAHMAADPLTGGMAKIYDGSVLYFAGVAANGGVSRTFIGKMVTTIG